MQSQDGCKIAQCALHEYHVQIAIKTATTTRPKSAARTNFTKLTKMEIKIEYFRNAKLDMREIQRVVELLIKQNETQEKRIKKLEENLRKIRSATRQY